MNRTLPISLLVATAVMIGGCPDSSKTPPASAPMASAPQVPGQPQPTMSAAAAPANGYGSGSADYSSGLTSPTNRPPPVVMPFPSAVPASSDSSNVSVAIPRYTPPPLGSAEAAPPLNPNEGGYQNPLTYLPKAPSNLAPSNAQGIELPVSHWNQPAIKKMLKDGSLKLPKGLQIVPSKTAEFGFDVIATSEYRGSRTDPGDKPATATSKAQIAGK